MERQAASTDAFVRTYPLFVRSKPGLVMRLRDEGLRIADGSLAYMQDGQWRTRAFADIATVLLSSGHIPRQGHVGQCRVTFRQGEFVTISTVNAAGMPDGTRHGDYADFVRDFHRALVESGAARTIRFVSGFSAVRSAVLNVALVAAGALFICLPLVLLVMTGRLETLAIMAVGGGMLYPALQTSLKNRPGQYDPSSPPDLLP